MERKVAETLSARAGSADTSGLAEAARQRASRRARRRTTGAVVGVVLAVAALPIAFALTRGDTPSTPVATDPPSSSAASPSLTPPRDGWRVESWRHVTLTVPADWAYGGGTDWCADDGGLEPMVVRPEAAVLAIGCSPQSSYGVYFGDSAATDLVQGVEGTVWRYSAQSSDQIMIWPQGTWLSVRILDDVAVWIATPEKALTQEVLDSVTHFNGPDANGCSARSDVPDAASGDGDRWSVCRYAADGWLEQSELLSAEDTASFQDAIAAAPVRKVLNRPACGEPAGYVIAGAGDLGSARITFASTCDFDNDLSLSGSVKELTSDVLYWALSPGWSGGTSGGVPMPNPLRR